MANNIKTVNEISKGFISSLKMPKRKSKSPVVVAMVGLVGSGRSSIARALAPLIGATVIESNTIRVALRQKGQDYNPVRNIAEKAVLKTLEVNSNVIMDSDFIDPKKRESLERKLKKTGAKIVYLRVSANPEVTIERFIKAKFNPNKDLYKSSAIAIREMWRRTPHHYNWSEAGGGRFIPKKLKIPFLEVKGASLKRLFFFIIIFFILSIISLIIS